MIQHQMIKHHMKQNHMITNHMIKTTYGITKSEDNKTYVILIYKKSFDITQNDKNKIR